MDSKVMAFQESSETFALTCIRSFPVRFSVTSTVFAQHFDAQNRPDDVLMTWSALSIGGYFTEIHERSDIIETWKMSVVSFIVDIVKHGFFTTSILSLFILTRRYVSFLGQFCSYFRIMLLEFITHVRQCVRKPRQRKRTVPTVWKRMQDLDCVWRWKCCSLVIWINEPEERQI